MKTNKLWICLVAGCLASCGASHDHKEEAHHHAEGHAGEIVLNEEQMKEAGVATERVAAADFEHVIRVGGRLLPSIGEEQTVVATTAGVVRLAHAASAVAGAAVRAGETVATIESDELQDGDPTQKARIVYETAQKAWQRAESLAADKIISQRELEQVRADYETAKAAYAGSARQATAKGLRVSSPMSGYVKNLMVTQGSYVSVGDPIMTVTQSRRLQLRADVPEIYSRDLRQVGGANFRLGGDKTVYRLTDLHGRLVATGRVSADGAHTIPVTFEFDNVGDFMAGTFAEVYLLGRPRQGVLSVPVSALTESQGVYYVYVAVPGEHGAFLRREVTLGHGNGVRVEITRGLKAGDEVVVKGVTQVRLASMSSSIPEGHSHNH